MNSFRRWITSLALGAALLVSAPALKAQIPLGFTYQGLLEENGVPYTGNVSFTIYLDDQAGVKLYLQTYPNVPIVNGVFNIVVGGTNSFPTTMTFNEQYLLQVVVTDGSGNTTTLPPTELWDAPYAINSGTVNGLSASPVPVSGDLFPVPIGLGYTGSAKLDPAFLPSGIPNKLLASKAITTIDNIGPDTIGNFEISAGSGLSVTRGTNGITINGPGSGFAGVVAGPGLTQQGSGIVTLSIAPGGVVSNMLAPNLQIGSTSSAAAELIVQDSEAIGNKALLIRGGIGANNSTGAADGSGLSPGSPQTYWADEVTVPSATETTLQIFNTIIGPTSTIVLTPFALTAATGQLAITAQSAGTFTVSSTTVMGTGGGGVVTGMNYMIVNH